MMNAMKKYDIIEAAKEFNGLPTGLKDRVDAVEEMMLAARAKITRRTVTSHDYVPGKIVFDEEEIDARAYAEETDLDSVVGTTQTTAAVTISWIPGVGPTVTETIIHRDNRTITTDYSISIDTDADDYDGRRMLEAAAAIRTIDDFSAACLAYELDTMVETREAYLSDLGIFAPVKTRLAFDVDCDHRRGTSDAAPYAHTEDIDASGDTIAYLSSVVPDSGGDTDGVTGVIRVYDHSIVSGMRVPKEVYLRTLITVYPTVAAVIGSPDITDYHDYTLSRRLSEEIVEDAYDEDEDDLEPATTCDYDDETPHRAMTAAYAEYVGARLY